MKPLLVIAALLLTGCSEQSAKQEQQRKDSRTPEELLAAVEVALKAEDFTTAEGVLTSLIDRNPADFDALGGRAMVRVFLGDATGATKDFEDAIRIDGEKGKKLKFFIADRSIWKAREFGMKKRYPEALKIYDVLLALYPRSGMAFHDRGGLKTSMGDYAGAIDDLTKAIEFDAGNNAAGDSYELRARAKRAKGNEEGAKADEAKAKEVAEASGRSLDR
jgi:tetratricopeptide (TPR) repeat protein